MSDAVTDATTDTMTDATTDAMTDATAAAGGATDRHDAARGGVASTLQRTV